MSTIKRRQLDRRRKRSVSPMAQHRTRLSLIKYMFRYHNDQKQAKSIGTDLYALQLYLKTINMNQVDRGRALNLIRHIESKVREIQKDINHDETKDK